MTESVSQLTSRSNPLVKKIRILGSGKHRKSQDLVLAEGTRVLEEMVRSGHTVDAVVVSENFGSEQREKRLLEAWMQRNIQLYQVSESLFHTLSCYRTSQGALAVVKVPEARMPETNEKNALILYANGIQDPGNLGTLIRTAAASGATLVCTSPGTVSARNPKTVRSSAGVFFQHIPVEHVAPEAFIRYCKERSIRIYCTDTVHGVPYTQADLMSSCAILLGNEGSGSMDEVFSDLPSLHIPMADGIESLNVALAGAVILFEAARQRHLT